MYCLDKNTNTLCAGKVEKDQQATIRPVEEESPDIKLKSDLACKKSRKKNSKKNHLYNILIQKNHHKIPIGTEVSATSQSPLVSGTMVSWP